MSRMDADEAEVDLDWTKGAPGEREALVTSKGDRLTYLQLRSAVQRAAARLAEAGAGPGRVVAVSASDPAGMLIALLAVHVTGAAALPLDWRAVGSQEEAVRRTRPVAIIREATLEGDLALDAPALDPRLLDPAAALLLFTSGSSGEPKGVVLSGTGLAANVQAIASYLPVREHPRTAVVLPLCYSYAIVGQAFVTLSAGGTLLLFSDVPFAATQLDLMARERASGLSSVPTSLRLLSQAARELAEGDRPPIGYLASAGAPLSPPVIEAMRAAFPRARLFNQYGLTEACPRVSALSDTEPAFERGSVGRPLPGLEAFAASPDGEPLPPGEEGVLLVRGPSVMLGYLDDPEGTARALRPEGLVTGDWGYRDAEGYLYVTGRRDSLVKVAGERISLEAVSSLLRQAPGVGEACVVALPDDLLGARLVAVVEGGAECLAEVRAIARRELPAAKRPQRYVLVDLMPRTPNGKLDLPAIRRVAERP